MRVFAGTIMVDVMAIGIPAVAAPDDVIFMSVDSRIGGHPIDVATDLVELGRAPDSVAVGAAVASGPFGSFARDVIAGYGTQTFLQDVPNEDTGRNLEVDGEDRRFHLDPEANWVLGAEARTFTGTWEVAQPGFRVDRVDGTGCGDAFCAGVILHLDEPDSPPLDDLAPDHLTEFLFRAQAVSASAATAVGCVEGVSAGTTNSILPAHSETVRLATQPENRRRP